MLPENQEAQIKSLKRHLIQLPIEATEMVNFGRKEIEKVIPHRPPFALIDKICQLNLSNQILLTETMIQEDDPIFMGHFPDHPVYPGVFQIEMMGQAGLCLIYFLQNQSTKIESAHKPVKGLFTRIHNAGFIRPVLPGDLIQVRAKMIDYDDFLGIMSVQICREEEICSHSILEAYLVNV